MVVDKREHASTKARGVARLVEVRNEAGFQRTTRSVGRAGALVVEVALETVWG